MNYIRFLYILPVCTTFMLGCAANMRQKDTREPCVAQAVPGRAVLVPFATREKGLTTASLITQIDNQKIELPKRNSACADFFPTVAPGEHQVTIQTLVFRYGLWDIILLRAGAYSSETSLRTTFESDQLYAVRHLTEGKAWSIWLEDSIGQAKTDRLTATKITDVRAGPGPEVFLVQGALEALLK